MPLGGFYMKKFFVSFLFVFSLSFSIAYAGILVKKVYFSSFPIVINGKNYSSESPILSYQNRTYVALREFAEMVDVNVDFVDGTIIINSLDISMNELENTNSNMDDKEIDKNDNVESNNRLVYVSKSGSKYHLSKDCNVNAYFSLSLAMAREDGYTLCKQCSE